MGGTNCDAETKSAIDDCGASSEIVHLNALIKKRNLLDYDGLVIPGGFSFGDHVRAGAILGKRMGSFLLRELEEFIEGGRPILGICNGFQALVELGLLPGFEGVSEYPEATLAINNSSRYECRWVHLRHENRGRCIFTRGIRKGRVLFMPVAHAEGRFMFPSGKEEIYLKKLEENDQLVFRYSDEAGRQANGRYPMNPNGSFHDIAGICDPSGRILGLMPHPERAYWGFQLPNWTGMKELPEYADGRSIFESMVEYIRNR